ncbi:unnamed protein product [Rotaria sordida]|uniref:Uncharacterized protein n=1 Tax=Rotaria sordida TaxID=392033 RepID=A0A814KHZ6_9BILA|nr:unnamed protein product [Rotaria sordida]
MPKQCQCTSGKCGCGAGCQGGSCECQDTCSCKCDCKSCSHEVSVDRRLLIRKTTPCPCEPGKCSCEDCAQTGKCICDSNCRCCQLKTECDKDSCNYDKCQCAPGTYKC